MAWKQEITLLGMAWRQEITLLDMAYVSGAVTGYGLFIQKTLLYGKPSKKLTFLSDMSNEAFTTPPPTPKTLTDIWEIKFTYMYMVWKRERPDLNDFGRRKIWLWKKNTVHQKSKVFCGLGHFATDVLIIHAKAFLFETLDLKLC